MGNPVDSAAKAVQSGNFRKVGSLVLVGIILMAIWVALVKPGGEFLASKMTAGLNKAKAAATSSMASTSSDPSTEGL